MGNEYGDGIDRSDWAEISTAARRRLEEAKSLFHEFVVQHTFDNVPPNYKFTKKKAFKLIKDFNFYLAPKQLTFQTDMDRMYSERRSRNNTGFSFALPTYYQKHFNWNRIYGLKYDITKALKFDFNATNNSTIEEPLTFISLGLVDE